MSYGDYLMGREFRVASELWQIDPEEAARKQEELNVLKENLRLAWIAEKEAKKQRTDEYIASVIARAYKDLPVEDSEDFIDF